VIPTEGRVAVDSWSSDGRLVAGAATDAGGQPIAVAIWDVAAKKLLRRIEMPLVRTDSRDTSFVYGTHDLVTQTSGGVTLVNTDTGQWRVILKLAPPFGTVMSGDGRTLVVERPAVEADLWLMEFLK
jgi:hypothetical protein